MQTQPNNVTITQKEAQEYCAYKRQKKIGEIMSAMRRSGSVLTENDSAPRVLERGTRLKQVSVRMSPTDIFRRGEIFLKSPLRVDCVVGGTGETFPSVKAYEAKRAIKAGAREITLLITPSAIASCRYIELRRELKKLRRATKGAILKVRVEKAYPHPTMARLVRLCAEVGADYFSVPYFSGCQHLQLEPFGRCLLEVSDVETLARFKEMAGAGIGRILTSHAWEIYSEWLKEVESIQLEVPVKKEEPLVKSPSGKADEGTPLAKPIENRAPVLPIAVKGVSEETKPPLALPAGQTSASPSLSLLPTNK